MSRADIFSLLDDENNRGPLITAAHGERIDFMDSLELNNDEEADVNDAYAYRSSRRPFVLLVLRRSARVLLGRSKAQKGPGPASALNYRALP